MRNDHDEHREVGTQNGPKALEGNPTCNKMKVRPDERLLDA